MRRLTALWIAAYFICKADGGRMVCLPSDETPFMMALGMETTGRTPEITTSELYDLVRDLKTQVEELKKEVTARRKKS